MKRTLQSSLTTLALATFVLAVVPNAHAGSRSCSNYTLNGSYAATITGTIAGEPFAELDLVTSEGQGTFSGSGTVSDNGTISTVTFTATYTVNSDCSGTASLSTGVTQNFVIHQNGSEVQFIATNSGTTVVGDAKRISGPAE